MVLQFRHFFWALLILILSISLFGLFFLYSASYSIDSGVGYYAMNQLIRIAIGLVAFLAVIFIGHKSFLNLAYVIYFATLILLGLVLVVGTQKYGATRWIDIGPFVIQPSEFSKISVILVLSSYLGSRKKNLYQKKRFVVSFLLIMIPLLLVLKEPDLGTAIIFLPILFCMLFVWGAKVKYFLITFTLGILSTPFLWIFLKPYQKDRLLAFIDPNKDPLGVSYTVVQSKIGIGSGGFFGKGWLQGTQNKLDFIPEHHTDFIFSVIGEEGGFLAVSLILLLFVLLFRLSFTVIRRTTDTCGRLLATGIISMLFFHLFINIGMTIGLMPVTGLPLPLISYGGSSMLTFFISFGLLVSIYKERSIF